MVATANWTWQEGADLVMSFIYKEGLEGDEMPVDLTGYQLRMDVVSASERVFTFNSDDIDDVAVDVVGLSDNEATLGSDGSVKIVVPRALTLPGGPVFDLFPVDPQASLLLNYDIFLRKIATNTQDKILRGTITVERSYTLWP